MGSERVGEQRVRLLGQLGVGAPAENDNVADHGRGGVAWGGRKSGQQGNARGCGAGGADGADGVDSVEAGCGSRVESSLGQEKKRSPEWALGAVVQELGGSMLDNGAQSRPAWEVFYPNPSMAMAALGCPSFFAGALGLVAFLSSAAQSRLQRQLCTCTTCTTGHAPMACSRSLAAAHAALSRPLIARCLLSCRVSLAASPHACNYIFFLNGCPPLC
jgi:hypothetical protein